MRAFRNLLNFCQQSLRVLSDVLLQGRSLIWRQGPEVLRFMSRVSLQGIFIWLSFLPLFACAVLYLCREGLIWWRSNRRLRSSTKRIQMTVALMSGRTVSLDMLEMCSILEAKQALAGLDVAPASQIRLFNGCCEMVDSDLIGASGSTHFNVVLRSRQCAEWLDKISHGQDCKLLDASDEIRSSKECALAAVRKFGLAPLQHVAPELRDDMDVILAAVQVDGLSLCLASLRFRTDELVALTAISRDREAILAVCEPLRGDRDFLRRAYWASSLDSKREARLTGNEFSLSCEDWEDMLYKRYGKSSASFWSFVHLLLRELNFVCAVVQWFSQVSTQAGPLVYFGISHRVSLNLILYNGFALFSLCFGFSRVLANMHIEFATFMAGHLVKPRRVAYGFCCSPMDVISEMIGWSIGGICNGIAYMFVIILSVLVIMRM